MDSHATTSPQTDGQPVEELDPSSARSALARRAIPSSEEQPTVTVQAAGKVLGLGRSASYAAAERGEIPTIRIGGRLVVPTAALRKMLGLAESVAV